MTVPRAALAVAVATLAAVAAMTAWVAHTVNHPDGWNDTKLREQIARILDEAGP